MIKLKVRNLSIKNKIILIILSVIIFVQTIGFIFVIIWDINRIKDETETALVLNTKLISNNCVVPLAFGDDQQAAEALSHLENIESVEMSCLIDLEGNVFATYPDTINKNDCPEIIEEEKVVFIDGCFYVYEPVMFQDEIYGTLVIKANSDSLRVARNNIIITMILLGCILNVVAFFSALRLQRLISKPIINLKNQFYNIAENQDYSIRVVKYSNDEIGHLYDGFNSLINQIQNRRIERDYAEKQLRESQEKLNLALQGGEIGIWEWDLITDITLWDPKMEKMFGLDEGSFNQTYEAFIECLHPEDVILVKNAIQNALNNIKPYDIIYRVIWKNKEIKYIRTKALISKDENKKPIKLDGVCFDVTEIKEAEAELKKHRETLEDIVKERTKTLENKNAELESFNQLFIDREFRIKELRDELERMKSDKEN